MVSQGRTDAEVVVIGGGISGMDVQSTFPHLSLLTSHGC